MTPATSARVVRGLCGFCSGILIGLGIAAVSSQADPTLPVVTCANALALGALGFWRGTPWAPYVNTFVAAFLIVAGALFTMHLGSQSWCPAPMFIDSQGICRQHP